MPVEGEAVIASVRGDAAVIGGGQVLHWPYGPRRLTTRTTPPRDARCRSSRTVWFLLGLNHEAASDDPSGSAQPRSLEKHPLIAGRLRKQDGHRPARYPGCWTSGRRSNTRSTRGKRRCSPST